MVILSWDPNMQIRNDIRGPLAANLNDSQLMTAGERIGAELDEEIDKAGKTVSNLSSPYHDMPTRGL